jgi:hypothetical protein
MIPFNSPLELFFLLIAGHMIGDFALQTEFVATNKNRHVRDKMPAEVRSRTQVIWPHLLTAHCFHHGLLVFLVTQKLHMAIAEVITHWITDYGKCERWYGFHTDQVIHILTKALWTALIWNQAV